LHLHQKVYTTGTHDRQKIIPSAFTHTIYRAFTYKHPTYAFIPVTYFIQSIAYLTKNINEEFLRTIPELLDLLVLTVPHYSAYVELTDEQISFMAYYERVQNAFPEYGVYPVLSLESLKRIAAEA
jgi:hypothetical protein